MARLADRIWELNWAPPQMLCYRPELRSEERGGFSVAKMRAIMESQRQAIAESPVYDADDVAAYYYYTAMRDYDLDVRHFPAVAIPEDSAFIEFRKPALRDMVGGERIASQLPHWWGWAVSKHEPADFERVFRHKAAMAPGVAHGLLCVLWMSPDDKSLLAPLAAFGLQVAYDGEILSSPAVALGFPNDPERVVDPKGLFGYFNALFLPAVMAMAFMACKSTKVTAVDRPDALNKARVKKKKKRPLVTANVIKFDEMKEVLRVQGQAGIQGLAGAMRQCRHYFVKDIRQQASTLILPPGLR